MNNFYEIISLINKAEKIAIFNHVNMDGDAVGSAFSLAEALKEKDVTVIMEEAPPAYLEFAAGDYVTSSDEAFDLAIAVDCGDISRLGNRKRIFENAKKKVCIDHHVSNKGYGDVNLILPEASSTCELIYELITEMKVPLTKKIAELLYTGIITDTGGFKFSNTTAESLLYSAQLKKAGADIAEVCINIYECESLAKLKLKARVLNSLKLFAKGRIAGSVITEADFLETGAKLADCEGFSGIGRSIEGVEASYAITVKDNVKVSLRSKHYVDVSKVAAHFGGGGHVRASGFTMDKKTDVKILEKELIKLLTEEVNSFEH